ncbi:hypothetical protein J2W36_004075 [Variovorax ginsengisoli]|uniref:Uncharacterized protein n=1 Tax=Variovorax ginsengisoli TaxID=363844 RepID=A0ABT9SC53_9BURK|nr:hypothetical protein [Variovorax ginsengisoli]
MLLLVAKDFATARVTPLVRAGFAEWLALDA